MYIFAPGAGCTGDCHLVQPGDDIIFNHQKEIRDGSVILDTSYVVQNEVQIDEMSVVASTQRQFNTPLESENLQKLSQKKFSDETMKKVTKMYDDWRSYRNGSEDLENIPCDIFDDKTITRDSLIFALTRFITEVKKLDGTDFPGKTLYEILLSIQFHLETRGYAWKLLNEECFKDIKYTLDNVMKWRTEQGLGSKVKKAEVLDTNHEEYLWSVGLLGETNPDQLLTTVIFMIGKECALCAGKEHYALRSPPFHSQFEFLRDDQGIIFLCYQEDRGFKTNKGGIKHRKIEPKQVDVYPVENPECCPLRILLTYLNKLPKDRKCQSLYLQPRKKYSPESWYQDRPAGVNRLRDCIKDICTKAGFSGFFSNHSLRSTAATRLYHCNIDEQLIQEITGHRSLAVRSYKRTSQAQRKMASNCVFSS